MGRRKTESVKDSDIKKTKKVKKTSKNKNKVKKIFAIILFWTIVTILVAGLVLGLYYIFTADRFKLKNVSIHNTEYYTEEEVVNAANLPMNRNMLVISKRKIKKRILNELPYIENVKIKMDLKNSAFKINVIERQSKYVINNKDTNEYIRVDKYGIMLEKVKAEEMAAEEIPLFGLSLDKNEEVGTKIPETEYQKISRFESIYDAFLNSKIEARVTSVKFENSKIILTLDYKTEVVTEVMQNIEYKMKFLKEILKEVSGMGGRIDLTLDNPTFVEKIG